jgi:hypothetical protein
MNTTILAIDLGKYKSVACILDQSTGEYRFTTFDTSRAEMQKIIAKEPPSAVIIEACLLAGWVHDLCGELGVRCLVANTASEAWKFMHLKRKTDKDDALRLVPPRFADEWTPLLEPSRRRNDHPSARSKKDANDYDAENHSEVSPWKERCSPFRGQIAVRLENLECRQYVPRLTFATPRQ